MYQPKEPITSAAEIKAILGPILPNQIAKVIDHIDAHCKAWIERSPFIVVSSINAAGAMDISPKGDPPGFVKFSTGIRLRYPTGSETTARIRFSTSSKIQVLLSFSSYRNGAKLFA